MKIKNKIILFGLNVLLLLFISYIDNNNLFSGNENKLLIEFKIKHSFFNYKKSTINNPTYYDYDYYLLKNNYSLEEIYQFIKNRPESDYHKLVKYLYDNEGNYLKSSDEEIIKSLKYLFASGNDIEKDSIYIKSIPNFSNIIKNNYIKEIFKNKDKKQNIYNRIKLIEEVNEYNKIYKEFLLDKIKNES